MTAESTTCHISHMQNPKQLLTNPTQLLTHFGKPTPIKLCKIILYQNINIILAFRYFDRFCDDQNIEQNENHDKSPQKYGW